MSLAPVFISGANMEEYLQSYEKMLQEGSGVSVSLILDIKIVLHNPYYPCMVYLPTFNMKINQILVKYTSQFMDPIP